MKKYQLCVIRKQGDMYHRISIRFHRDTVTGELSVSFSGGGRMILICLEEKIPDLIRLISSQRRFPCAILGKKSFFSDLKPQVDPVRLIDRTSKKRCAGDYLRRVDALSRRAQRGTMS